MLVVESHSAGAEEIDHLVYFSFICSVQKNILNSILFLYGGDENVEMHGIHFNLACSED